MTFLTDKKENKAPLEQSPNVEVAGTSDIVFKTKRGEMGAVMVEVTPLSPTRYKLDFNTHSVVLDFDFKDIIVLADNNGLEYKAVSWSGERGGHHLSGEMIFPTLDPSATTTKLTINGIENEVLSFEWAL